MAANNLTRSGSRDLERKFQQKMHQMQLDRERQHSLEQRARADALQNQQAWGTINNLGGLGNLIGQSAQFIQQPPPPPREPFFQKRMKVTGDGMPTPADEQDRPWHKRRGSLRNLLRYELNQYLKDALI